VVNFRTKLKGVRICGNYIIPDDLDWHEAHFGTIPKIIAVLER